MRSRFAAILVSGAFLLAGAPVAVAKTMQHQFSGEVSRTDSTAKTFVVKDHATSAKEMTFSLAPDAKIMQGAKARSLAELKVGERVKVSYTDEGSKHQAKRVEVLPAKTAKAPPAKTPEKKSGY